MEKTSLLFYIIYMTEVRKIETAGQLCKNIIEERHFSIQKREKFGIMKNSEIIIIRKGNEK